MRASPSVLEAALRRPGELALVPYLMAGFPSLEASIETGRRLAGSGAAAIELGIPFSDPLADGPVIQRAGQAALARGATLAGCLRVAAAVAATGLPTVLMGYVNPILAHGPERFAREAAEAGVRGVIVPDLPPEEAEPVRGPLRAAGLDTVFLVAPTSTPERVRRCCEASSGFVYCVTVTGTTGTRQELPAGLDGLLGRVRAVSDRPVAAGFGISLPEHLRALREMADAAVVGSAIVREIEEGRDPLRLVEELLRACR
ncbi:MAG: tryptophan synthase subunit alpha [Candidatus Dormibacteraceae bacterium]